MVKKGMYMVRITSMEKRDMVLRNPIPFFNKKLIIMKAWSAKMDICRDNVLKTILSWIQLKLAFKYWGESCLGKIVGSIGKLMKINLATRNRDKLQYARVMVEIKMDQEFPGIISFVYEQDNITCVDFHYEWKPIVCRIRKGMGHETKDCVKTVVRKEWRPKKVVEVIYNAGNVQKRVETREGNEFREVKNLVRRILTSPKPVETHNIFEVLNVVVVVVG